ncbi:MAG: hypothetical protein ACTHQ3_15990 [Motilibacteraceae bacterium]
MTYLPGQDEAILPGHDRITADRVVEDDRHTVILNASVVAYPLDGLLPTLARTLADVGLLDEFCTLGRNRSSHPRVMAAVDALRSEPSIARLLQLTLTPEDAERIATDLRDAALEPAKCRCGNYAVDGEHCGPHIPDPAEDADVAWEVAG